MQKIELHIKVDQVLKLELSLEATQILHPDQTKWKQKLDQQWSDSDSEHGSDSGEIEQLYTADGHPDYVFDSLDEDEMWEKGNRDWTPLPIKGLCRQSNRTL